MLEMKIIPKLVRPNQGTKFRFFRLKYRLSVGPETILLTDSRLAKKLEKNRKNSRNIGNSRYFGDFSKLYLTRACSGISEKISVNIRDISVKYR